MPDDDRHTRDRVRAPDPLHDRIRDLAAQAREQGRAPRRLLLPTAEDTAARALRRITDTLGGPDLDGAALMHARRSSTISRG